MTEESAELSLPQNEQVSPDNPEPFDTPSQRETLAEGKMKTVAAIAAEFDRLAARFPDVVEQEKGEIKNLTHQAEQTTGKFVPSRIKQTTQELTSLQTSRNQVAKAA